MSSQQQSPLPSRHIANAHHNKHPHRQPRYVEADSGYDEDDNDDLQPLNQMKNDGNSLQRIHSRPEDYKNKYPKGNLVEYICFDRGDHPQESDEHDHGRDNKHGPSTDDNPLNRHSSNASSATVRTDDSGYDSEDELTLPPTYHHDIASRGHNYDSWCASKRYDSHKNTHDRHSSSHIHHNEGSRRHEPDRQPCEGDNSVRRTSHDSPPQAPSDQHLPTKQELVAKIAEHLQSHRDAYHHRNKSDMVDELLGEVVRKVADGGLDGNMIKEVIREVQHVL